MILLPLKFKDRDSDHSSFSGLYELLPPANKVWGKVMFLHVSVIQFTGGICLLRGSASEGQGSASKAGGGGMGCLLRFAC